MFRRVAIIDGETECIDEESYRALSAVKLRLVGSKIWFNLIAWDDEFCNLVRIAVETIISARDFMFIHRIILL